MSDDADERERAEAERLARALDADGTGGGDDGGGERAPDDALEAAALLRYGAHEAELRTERAEAVLAGLLPRVGASAPAGKARRRVVRFAPIAVGTMLAAAAVVSLVVTMALQERAAEPSMSVAAPVSNEPTSGGGAGLSPASALPAPPPHLLAVQAALTGKKAARDRVAFEVEMRSYRERVLRSLEHAYPARTGMLELRGRR